MQCWVALSQIISRVQNVNERLKVEDGAVQYATKEDLDKELANYAKVDVCNKLQGTVQKIQAENISVLPTFVKRVEMEKRLEAMETENERKMEEFIKRMQSELSAVTAKFEGIRKVLSD